MDNRSDELKILRQILEDVRDNYPKNDLELTGFMGIKGLRYGKKEGLMIVGRAPRGRIDEEGFAPPTPDKLKEREILDSFLRKVSEYSIERDGMNWLYKKWNGKKPYNEKWTKAKALKEVKEFLEDECFVAVDNEEILGFILYNNNNDDKKKAYIREIWLKPKAQGKGIGRALVEKIEDLYKKKGIKIIRLVTKRNSNAFGFYKKLNYKKHKELIFMERKLR